MPYDDHLSPQNLQIHAQIAQGINTYNAEAAAHEAEAQARAIQEEQAKARRKMALKDLIGTLKTEEIAKELATHARLEAQLAELRAKAHALATHLAQAEAAWEVAAEHTLTDAQLLQTLRDETPKVLAQIAPLERDLIAVEERIAELRGAQEEKQRRTLAEEQWTPFVKRLVPQARQLLALLREQQAIRERLSLEGAWPYARVDELTIDGRYGENVLMEKLTQWLTEVERAGYRI